MPDDDAPAVDPPAEVPSERARRLADLDDLRAGGVDPYPVRFDRDRTLAELRADFGDLPPGTETEVRVRVAGRIRGCAPADVRIGMTVAVGFEPGPGDVSIPSFVAA